MFDFTTFPTLTTERLRLRQITHDDADAIVALFGSPDVLRYLNNPPVESRDQAIGLIDFLNGYYTSGDAVQWAITRHGDDTLIGTCGTWEWAPDDRHVDIGYHIMPSQWGHGYATEAARAIIAWSFENLDVHRIQADCTEGNLGSERVLLKCGFTVEGIWRESCWEHGRFVNIKQFGLLRREWTIRP